MYAQENLAKRFLKAERAHSAHERGCVCKKVMSCMQAISMDIERSFRKDVERKWQINAGLRFSF